jgi:hypothetical protein
LQNVTHQISSKLRLHLLEAPHREIAGRERAHKKESARNQTGVVQSQNQKQKIKRRIPCLCANCFTCRTKNASVVWVPQEGAPAFQPCPEHEKLFKKAASARREHDELRRQLGKVVGTDQFEIVNQRARAVLEEAEAAMNEYLKHVREHEC